MGKSFSKMTDSQQMRDKAVLKEIDERFVSPLLEELNTIVDGYREMDDREKFVSLLRLNEEHAQKGDSLLVDFGSIDGNSTWTAFYAGESLFTYQEWDDVKRYCPLHVDSDLPGLGGRSDALILNNLLLYEESALERFAELPICFKLAVIARTIQQNLLVNRVDACRYAAGFDKELHLTRWRVRPLESGNTQRFGWLIEIRDTKPENELMKELARKMRSSVQADMNGYGYIPTDEGDAPLYAEADEPRKKKRTRHETTERLVYFIEDVLPSTGRYVGRSGDGRRIGWEQAFAEYCESYPNDYSSEKSFRDSYYNARKARQEEAYNVRSDVEDSCEVMELDDVGRR